MISRITATLAARLKALQEKEKGFTLIELLVVVIIIGVLAAIAIPIYIGIQNNAKDSAVQSDLTNAKIAVVAFYTDQSKLPSFTTDDVELVKLGLTKSDNTSAFAFGTGATPDAFCIQAARVDDATRIFSITSASGVKEGACS